MAFSTQENVIYGKNIFLCASVFCILLYEEYLPLCELTNMVFSMLENVICQKNIHICMNIFNKYLMKNIYLCASWLKWCFLHWKIFSTQWTYSYARVFNWRIFYLCACWLKSGFLHLKIFSTRRIYTSVWVCDCFLYSFKWRIFPSVQFD